MTTGLGTQSTATMKAALLASALFAAAVDAAVQGFDISHYQTNVDFAAAYSAGAQLGCRQYKSGRAEVFERQQTVQAGLRESCDVVRKVLGPRGKRDQEAMSVVASGLGLGLGLGRLGWPRVRIRLSACACGLCSGQAPVDPLDTR